MKVPVDWADRENSIWAAQNNEALGELVGASGDWSGLHDMLDVPGLMLATSAANDQLAHDLVEGKVPPFRLQRRGLQNNSPVMATSASSVSRIVAEC